MENQKLESVSVAFKCKLCLGLLPTLEKFIEHKHEKHFSEFRNIKSIVFEEKCVQREEKNFVKKLLTRNLLKTKRRQMQDSIPILHSKKWINNNAVELSITSNDVLLESSLNLESRTKSNDELDTTTQDKNLQVKIIRLTLKELKTATNWLQVQSNFTEASGMNTVAQLQVDGSVPLIPEDCMADTFLTDTDNISILNIEESSTNPEHYENPHDLILDPDLPNLPVQIKYSEDEDLNITIPIISLEVLNDPVDLGPSTQKSQSCPSNDGSDEEHLEKILPNILYQNQVTDMIATSPEAEIPNTSDFVFDHFLLNKDDKNSSNLDCLEIQNNLENEKDENTPAKKNTSSSYTPIKQLESLKDWLARQNTIKEHTYQRNPNLILLEPDPLTADGNIGPVTKEAPIICKLCRRKLVSEVQVMVHSLYCWHHNKAGHSYCIPCNVTFEDAQLLQVHNAEDHSNTRLILRNDKRPYKCPVSTCLQYYKTEQTVIVHVKRHLGECLIKCKEVGCGQKFMTYTNLRRHMIDNHPEKLRHVLWFCKYCPNIQPFEKKRLHRSHMNKHRRRENRAAFHCTWEGCLFSSTRAYVLEGHVRSVHEQGIVPKPYKKVTIWNCPYCGKIYWRTPEKTRQFKNHVKKHEFKNKCPFKCDYEGCLFGCSDEVGLKDHVREIHEAPPKVKKYSSDVEYQSTIVAGSRAWYRKLNEVQFVGHLVD